MKHRILVTGVPSPEMFCSPIFSDFSAEYGRRKEIRYYDDILSDFEVCGNTGNLLIGEGGLASLGKVDFLYLPMWYVLGILKRIDRVAELRKNFDKLILITAGLLHADYSAHIEAKVVEDIDLPTLVMGMGSYDISKLPYLQEGTLEFIRHLAERGHYVFTRGKFTEEFLLAKGVKNARATGCPSIYFRPQKMIESIRRIKNVDVRNLESCMIGGYLGHINETNDDVRVFSQICPKVKYVMQDEYIHYNLVFENDRSERRSYNPITGEISLKYTHESHQGSPGDIPAICRPSSVHVFYDTDDWRRWSTHQNFFFGRRFHGGIAAMQVGIPTLFVAVDDRMREMLKYAGFPYLEPSQLDFGDKLAHIEAYIAGFDAKRAVSRYKRCESHFRSALSDFLGISGEISKSIASVPTGDDSMS